MHFCIMNYELFRVISCRKYNDCSNVHISNRGQISSMTVNTAKTFSITENKDVSIMLLTPVAPFTKMV